MTYTADSQKPVSSGGYDFNPKNKKIMMTIFEKEVMSSNKANLKHVADALERIASALECSTKKKEERV